MTNLALSFVAILKRETVDQALVDKVISIIDELIEKYTEMDAAARRREVLNDANHNERRA